jgi:hypothetical protein
MCENVVGPICPALEQFANEIAKLSARCFRPPLVRLPRFSGVGFLFTSFSQAFKDRDFKLGLRFFCTRSCQDWFASKIMPLMKLWSWQKENLPSIGHSVRTALAATVSVIVARLVQMPEAYWAAIATLVVMQSTLGATLTLSIERVVATAVGASVGAVEANYFGANLAAFMVAIFFIGLLSFGFRLERTAYRYASVTLTIIVLIPRTNPAWIVALHRFIEVSVGIIVALGVVALWPERSRIAAKSADE